MYIEFIDYYTRSYGESEFDNISMNMRKENKKKKNVGSCDS
jgi:hypothetical protein